MSHTYTNQLTHVIFSTKEREPPYHRRVTFQEEFIAFLKKNGIAYDDRYIWS